MQRSSVKTGRLVQRSRATTRRRDRGEKRGHEPNPDDLLCGWLYANRPLSSLEEVKAVDRKRFLQETGNFNVPPGERLRHLAIHAESEATWGDQPEGWVALRSIYEHAARFGERDVWQVHCS